jgi:Ni2+-binding GTPase involved in maturation of urease and hydrogenase
MLGTVNIMVIGNIGVGKTSLLQTMTKLTKNKNIIFAAFEGDAATQFQSDLETDLSNLKTVIGMLELEINGLRNVNDKHYLGCEQSLHTLVNELNNSKV